jgi:hypothetical protein
MEQIEAQYKLLGLPANEHKFKLYFYALELDGKMCIKPGKSKQELSKRIKQYLFKEHLDKSKNMDTFMIAAVYEFDSEDVMKSAEGLIKSGFKKYPLNEGQNGNIEQYTLEPAWNFFKEFINNMPFKINSWIHPHVDIAINNLITMEKVKKNTATAKFRLGLLHNNQTTDIVRPATNTNANIHRLFVANSDMRPRSPLSANVNMNVRMPINRDAILIVNEDVRPPIENNGTEWIARLNDIIEKETKIEGIGKGSRDAMKSIDNKDSIDRKSLTSACKDIKEKMKLFNKKNGKAVQFNKVINYISLGQ